MSAGFGVYSKTYPSDRDASGWTYKIDPQTAESSFNFVVRVYLDGRQVGRSFADTRWGARLSARSMRRKYYRRLRATSERGSL